MIRLFRATAIRIAIAFTASLVLLTYLVFAILDWQLYHENVVLTRTVLEDEVGGALADGSRQLEERLQLRLTQDLRRLDYVGLYDPDGKLVFGNAAATLDLPVDGHAHIVRTAPPRSDTTHDKRAQDETALFVARRRPDGGTLLLGRSLIYVDQLRTAALRIFMQTILPVTAVALAIGVVVSARASRRLLRIKEAIAGVMSGELDRRLPVRRSPDDLDESCRAVNRMLDEIGRLVGQIRSVGDNIAHDLRTPLAVMRMRLERGLIGDEAGLRALVASALVDLDRALNAVTALLRISQLESSTRRGSFTAVDLAIICRDACDLLQPLAEAKGVALHLELSGDARVLGDADLLREVLVNLVDNAVKFTPGGGSVTIAWGHSDFLVRVSDTGPGIAPEERAKVIRRFYRAGTTSAAAGVGLGLSMAATIIELHGLNLEISDARSGLPNPGAAFTIRQGTAARS